MIKEETPKKIMNVSTREMLLEIRRKRRAHPKWGAQLLRKLLSANFS